MPAPATKVPTAKPPRGMPGSVSIAGQVWRVEYVPGLAATSRVLGQTQDGDRLILLDADQAAESLKSTLWHECLHAMLAMAGTDLDADVEEKVVSALETLLVSTLRANKPWWR
jgi:hypothetical protein